MTLMEPARSASDGTSSRTSRYSDRRSSGPGHLRSHTGPDQPPALGPAASSVYEFGWVIVGSVPHYPEVGQACRGRDWAKGGIPSPSNAYAPTLAKNVVTESVASPYTAEFCLGFGELGFLEGLAKGGCETRSSAPHLRQDAHAGCRGKRGAALLVAGFSPENAASAQQLI